MIEHASESEMERTREWRARINVVYVWNEKGCSNVMGQMVISWPGVTI